MFHTSLPAHLLVRLAYAPSQAFLTDSLAAIPEPGPPPPPMTVEEIDVTRHREIASKAVSAIILLTLKWFKVSRKSNEI